MFPLRDSIFCKTAPVVVLAIIALNSAVFLYEQTLGPIEMRALLSEYALIPARHFDPRWSSGMGLDAGDYKSFLTCMFLHSGWFHFILNMWTLWIFGCAMEDRLGHVRFVVFYLLCGLAASMAHTMLYPQSAVPVVGASGAVAGVISAYAFTYPAARLTVLIPLFCIIPLFVEIPAVFFAIFWFLMQIMQGWLELYAPGLGGGVAWWAHLGGFFSGIILLWLMAPAPVEPEPTGEL
jgi:membrane associated rhomboid family serine protease